MAADPSNKGKSPMSDAALEAEENVRNVEQAREKAIGKTKQHYEAVMGMITEQQNAIRERRILELEAAAKDGMVAAVEKIMDGKRPNLQGYRKKLERELELADKNDDEI